jgi:hypothetical protein
MLSTYEVYLTDHEGRSWFEPLLAENPTQLLATLRERIVRQELREARIEAQGQVLLTLAA